MARTAVVTKAVAGASPVDTVGWGTVSLLGTAGKTATVLVGPTAAGCSVSTSKVIDPATGEQTFTFPASGILSYIGDYEFITASGSDTTTVTIILGEPRQTN